MKTGNKNQGKPRKEETLNRDNSKSAFLILHNDDHHSFDYVIESLVNICDHDRVQAEQCALIVHHKGQCDIMKGQKETLKSIRHKLVDKGLKATIEN